jgi:two-component system, OmpR family, phosphate regulon sensor histidine kinase PhoR
MNARNSFFILSWLVVESAFVLAWFLLDVSQHRISTPLYWVFACLCSLVAAAALSTLAVWIMGRSIRELAPVARALFDGDSFRRLTRVNNTELKEAVSAFAAELEESLSLVRAERDLLHAVLESMEEGVLVSDRGGKIVRSNATLRGWLNTQSDNLGKNLSDVFATPALNRKLTEARLQGETQRIELQLALERRCMVRIAPLPNLEGGAVAVFHDVTELRRLERVRRDFVANVSHELRTPIFAIRGAAETLADGGLDDPGHAQHFVEVIERHATRIASILTDLLELSRLESSGERLDDDPLDLVKISEELLQERTELFASKQITWSLEAANDLPAAAGNLRAIRRVLVNLLENAIHYTEVGGKIIVCISSLPDERTGSNRMQIEVRDTGVGIAPQHLSRIFERFYRVDAGRSRAQGGTGLGLSIVRHFVQAMGGDVVVESTLGQGTTFRVSLHTKANSLDS